MEETGGGRESTRKIFGMAARSGQRNARLHSARGAGCEWKREKGRQSLRTKWIERKSAAYWQNAGGKRKRTRTKQNKDTNKQERKERIKEWRYNREYERCTTEEVPENLGKESARERKQVLDGRRGEKVQNVLRGEREWMRRNEKKERGEILNEDGREIGWMKEIWNRRDRIEKERGGR
jgi:hypothetical protein